MLFVSWIWPHAPYDPPKELLQDFKTVTIPPNVPPGASRQFAQKALPGYYGMIAGVDKVLADIAAWRPSSHIKRDLRRTTYQYFAANRERMRYRTWLEKGYHIGSGVVEATCKHVVAQRLDQAGMHWRQESAEAMVALRAAQLSTCPPDLRPYCAMPN